MWNTRWDAGNKWSRCLGWAKTAKMHLLVEIQINSSSVMMRMRMRMIKSSSMVAEGPNLGPNKLVCCCLFWSYATWCTFMKPWRPSSPYSRASVKGSAFIPAGKGSEDQVSYLSRMLHGQHINNCIHFFWLFQNNSICVPSGFFR